MAFHRISLRPSPCRGREVPSLPGKHGKALTSTCKKHNEHLTVFRLQFLHLLGSDADIWLVLTGSRNHAQFSTANVIQIFVVQMIQMFFWCFYCSSMFFLGRSQLEPGQRSAGLQQFSGLLGEWQHRWATRQKFVTDLPRCLPLSENVFLFL